MDNMNILSDKFISMYDGSNIEEVLIMLRKAGASQLECTKLLYKTMNIPLSDADRIVLNSKAWEREKEVNKYMRNTFFQE